MSDSSNPKFDRLIIGIRVNRKIGEFGIVIMIISISFLCVIMNIIVLIKVVKAAIVIQIFGIIIVVSIALAIVILVDISIIAIVVPIMMTIIIETDLILERALQQMAILR